MGFAVRHRADRHRLRKASRKLLAAGGLLLVLLAAPLSFGSHQLDEFASAAVQRAKSFLELIQQRSPGKRTQAQLTKFRHRIAARPHERALPKVRVATPVLPPVSPALFELVAPPIPVQTASLNVVPIAPLAEQTPFFPVPYTPPQRIIVPRTDTPFSPPSVITPATAVPEPGTWATMLLAFALLGWRLKGRREKRVAPSAWS